MLEALEPQARQEATLSVCRACLAPDPLLFMRLGDHSPAQMLIRQENLNSEQPTFPLNVHVCLECGLIAIPDQIPAEYFRQYLYVPSGAATMHSHFEGFATRLAELAGADGLIVDIGSNDGLLLAACNELGCRTLGIDPAENIAELAALRGVRTHIAYFHPQSAADVLEKYGPAKVIVTTNTFNHIGDLHTFMQGVDILLADDGVFVIEVPHALDMVRNAEFDNIYHEHLSEFSLLSIRKLSAFFDLEIVDVHRMPNIHGGSLRIVLARASSGVLPNPIVAEILNEERSAGLLDEATYVEFVNRVNETGEQLLRILDQLKAQGKKIVGYGASARGNTMITYFGIGSQYLDFLVDKNLLKHNLYSPNLRLPIKPVEAIESEHADVLFMMAWNFFDEIREQQGTFLARGGEFLVPFPTPYLCR